MQTYNFSLGFEHASSEIVACEVGEITHGDSEILFKNQRNPSLATSKVAYEKVVKYISKSGASVDKPSFDVFSRQVAHVDRDGIMVAANMAGGESIYMWEQTCIFCNNAVNLREDLESLMAKQQKASIEPYIVEFNKPATFSRLIGKQYVDQSIKAVEVRHARIKDADDVGTLASDNPALAITHVLASIVSYIVEGVSFKCSVEDIRNLSKHNSKALTEKIQNNAGGLTLVDKIKCPLCQRDVMTIIAVSNFL